MHGGKYGHGSSHEDRIVLLIAEIVATLGLGSGAVDVSAFQMNMRRVDQHRSRAALVVVQGVNAFRSLQQFQSFAGGCE